MKKLHALTVPILAVAFIVISMTMLIGLVVNQVQTTKANHTALCQLSQKRWVVQDHVILRLSLPIAINPAVDEVTKERLILYNEQQTASRTQLLGELGPKPALC